MRYCRVSHTDLVARAVAEYAGAWPSRDYIYNGARKDLKEGAFALFRESQVVIDVHDLADEEKRQICERTWNIDQVRGVMNIEN